MSDTALRSTRTALGVGAALVALSAGQHAFGSERYAAFVMDAQTNEVLYSEMANEERFPASLTKMMTLYMLFEALERRDISLNTKMTTSSHAARQVPTKLGLRVGDKIRVEDAIKALVTKSANDAAVVIAEKLGGSESAFAASMTRKARELGMTKTTFANASGLPNPRQRSTAHDIALLSRALVTDFPGYYSYFKTPGFSWRKRYARNHNHLLGEVEGVDGIKTGYTNASGFNLASSVVRDGHRIIAVVMGGRTAASRDAQMVELIEDAYAQIAAREDNPANDVTLASLPVNRVKVDIKNESSRVTGAIPESGKPEVASISVAARATPVPADQAAYTAPAPVNMAGAMAAAAGAVAHAAASTIAPPAAAATLTPPKGAPLVPYAPGGEKPTDGMSPLEEIVSASVF